MISENETGIGKETSVLMTPEYMKVTGYILLGKLSSTEVIYHRFYGDS